jgi:hypothetical protein
MLKNPNSSKLALRDPAMAALMGAIAVNGADFGADGDFGDEMGDFGDEAAAEVAAEMAADYGDEVGAAVQAALTGRGRGRAALARTPANPAAIGAWNKMRAVQARSSARGALLDPNRGSTIKVEEYELPMSEAIVIGTAQTFVGLSTTPQTTFKPEALVCNAPMPGFAFIQDIKAANVSASVSNFLTDAYNYNAQATRSKIALPKLLPQTTVSITGQYTGAIPPGVLAGSASFFTATLYGPSTLAGG